MFLHLGQGNLVFQREVVGIFSARSQAIQTNKELIEATDWEGELHKIEGATKSIVVTNNKIYLCPLATSTLEKRWIKQDLNF